MPNDIMPTDQIGQAKWKLEAMRAWLRSWCNGCPLGNLSATITDVLYEISEDDFDPYSPTYLAMGRYLVMNIIDGERNEFTWLVPGTLEEAQAIVEAHVFAEPRDGYEQTSRVFDSHLRKELTFTKVQKIEWNLDAEDECVPQDIWIKTLDKPVVWHCLLQPVEEPVDRASDERTATTACGWIIRASAKSVLGVDAGDIPETWSDEAICPNCEKIVFDRAAEHEKETT